MSTGVSEQRETSARSAREVLTVHGGRRLQGEYRPSGAKNAALPLLVAAALGEAPTVLENVPLGLADVRVLIECLRALGAEVEVIGPRTVRLRRAELGRQRRAPDAATRIRYSLLLLGLCAACGVDLDLPLPGGCSIGERKYDLHLQALEALGARIASSAFGLRLTAGELRGADIRFPLPTTGGTENALLAAVGARGETVIHNANTRPEIRQMATLLRRMGADIEEGARVFRVRGGRPLAGGARLAVMPGWDEAVTAMAAAAITGGDVRIRGLSDSLIFWDLTHLRHAGVRVFDWMEDLFVSRRGSLKGFDVITGPPPFLNSDMQPVFAALALFCEEESTLTDTRFQDRFQYVSQLRRFGADIEVYGNSAVVRPRPLTPAQVRATDLRGGAALVLTALGIEGESIIENVGQIDRGYEDFHRKLRALGADIERVAVGDTALAAATA